MLIESQVQGVSGISTDGAVQALRAGRSRQLMVADAQARYYDMAKNGTLFTASNTAGIALSVNSTTATGLIITNPPGSGKDLVLVELCVAITTAPAAAATLVLTGSLTGAVTHTTPLTNVFSAYFGGAASQVALIDTAATVPTPAVRRAIGGGPVGASTLNTAFIKDEIAGAIVMSPGSCLSVQSLTTAISVVASLTWMEVPQ